MKIKTCGRSECEVVFETKDNRKRYCSRSCAATVNNTLYPKRYKMSNGRLCRFCDAKLYEYHKTFCSRECQSRYRSETQINDWLSGRTSGSLANGLLKSWTRNYLLEQAGHRCQSPDCAVPGGWSIPNPVTGKPILTVDHIDGNWKNNAVDNLIVLCYSCHTLTPTFGSLNKKSAGVRGSGNRAYKRTPPQTQV